MLSGNPDTFAVWCDQVDSWSTDSFKNGCFGYFIEGKLIWSLQSTLGVDLHRLSLLPVMTQSAEDEHTFNMPPVEAYRQLCERTFPADDSNAQLSDFTHLVSSESLSDEGYYFFLVELGEAAKLVAGFKDDMRSVRHIVLKRGEFQEVVREAIGRFET
ncbi:immunity 42 family protein [Caballeronia novacaledonica]|uniref:Uncharacterized protein n=1 Tax=Caballeronia novacaledonica TaxID=1544861 RepID=A0AA37IFI0_9BURK|nr:immunity 42 family protein [Caballeronia novacaledonica]GJH25796.1 hypothetical protein CBA19CS42_14790 [Caballeronia novacaledonica]